MNSFFLQTLIFLTSRYLHIVCSTVLVGGTLFYEMVVPPAIDELRPEQQLLIFARARWFFKWIVWVSAALILISGCVSSAEHWRQYSQDQIYRTESSGRSAGPPEVMELTPLARPGWWWAAHASTGIIAVLISLSLTIGKVPPNRPIRWMRLNLVILLVVMFFATVARETRTLATSPPRGSLEPFEISGP